MILPAKFQAIWRPKKQNSSPTWFRNEISRPTIFFGRSLIGSCRLPKFSSPTSFQRDGSHEFRIENARPF